MQHGLLGSQGFVLDLDGGVIDADFVLHSAASFLRRLASIRPNDPHNGRNQIEQRRNARLARPTLQLSSTRDCAKRKLTVAASNHSPIATAPMTVIVISGRRRKPKARDQQQN